MWHGLQDEPMQQNATQFARSQGGTLAPASSTMKIQIDQLPFDFKAFKVHRPSKYIGGSRWLRQLAMADKCHATMTSPIEL